MTKSDRLRLATLSLRGAHQLRRTLSIPRHEPINVFEVAKNVGAEIRFVDASSLEGLVVQELGLKIILPTFKHRPSSRVRFTCAHELAHWHLGHGTKADRIHPGGSIYDDDEFMADIFASQLLMPKPAVVRSMAKREIDIAKITPAEVYIVGCELGVGYETLISHLEQSLDMITRKHAAELLRHTPKKIREDFSCSDYPYLFLADALCAAPSIDLEVGDALCLPNDCVVGNCPLIDSGITLPSHRVYRACRPGTSSISLGLNRDAQLRVARKHFQGLYQYRFLEDPDIE